MWRHVTHGTGAGRLGVLRLPSPAITMTDLDAVLAANQRFYDAFEASDMDVMSDVWSHDASVACTHPGWTTLHGWAEVASSWFALFQQPSPLQFILTALDARIVGQLAWVTLDENLIGAGSGPGQTVAAVNIFQQDGDGWRMVCHHGSAVASSND